MKKISSSLLLAAASLLPASTAVAQDKLYKVQTVSINASGQFGFATKQFEIPMVYDFYRSLRDHLCIKRTGEKGLTNGPEIEKGLEIIICPPPQTINVQPLKISMGKEKNGTATMHVTFATAEQALSAQKSFNDLVAHQPIIYGPEQDTVCALVTATGAFMGSKNTVSFSTANRFTSPLISYGSPEQPAHPSGRIGCLAAVQHRH